MTVPARTSGGRPGSAPGKVRWDRLVLRGFGPYRGEVRVCFPDGLVTLVAPNEAGKSTLVAGLLAVLFGLPAASDPLRFGQARFRHWAGPARFEGELEFQALDGCAYRLHRDFSDHRVRLMRLTEAGPVVELDGVHNPGATRRNLRYEARIQELLGIGSRELLVQTFCVEQPLPPAGSSSGGSSPGRNGDRPALTAEVQRLLAGSGGGSHAAALEHLLDRLKELTRATADLGVSSRNQRVDRERERLEGRIRELEQAIARDRELADGLEEVRRRRAQLARERQELERAVVQQERLARAWHEWRRFAERYRQQVARRVEMEGALQRARALEQALEHGRQQLTDEWPELQQAGDDVGDKLDQLLALERIVARDEGQRAALFREWQEAAARAARAVWLRYQRLSDQLRQLDEGLQAYHPFATANDGLRQLVRNIEQEEARLRNEVEAAARELERREAAWREVEREAQILAETYADVSGLSAVAVEALERKPRLLEERRRLAAAAQRADAERSRRRSLARWGAVVAAAASGLVGGGIVALLGIQGVARVAVIVSLAAVGAGVAWWLLTRRVGDVDESAEALRQVEEELRRLDDALGASATESPDRLRALWERRREWEVRRQALEERRQRLPAAAELDAWRARHQAALRSQAEFEARVAPFRRRYPDPAGALRAWEDLCRRRQRVAAALMTLCREEWGVPPEAVATRMAHEAGGDWAELAALLATDEADGAPGDRGLAASPAAIPVAAVAAGLERLDPHPWEGPSDEVAAAGSPVAAGAVTPGGQDADELDAELERLIVAQRGRAAAAREGLQRLAAELDENRRLVRQLRQRLGPVLAAAGGDVGRARSRWGEYQRQRQSLRELEQELAGVLAAWQVDDTRALAVKVEQVRDAALLVLQDLQRLAEAYEGLPSPEAVDDPVAVEGRVRALDDEVEQLQKRLRALNEADRALLEEETRLAGHQPINIAAAELELAEAYRQREALQEEIEALVLAHRELQAAIREYHAAYRERLEQSASQYFSRITNRPGRRVALDDQFQVSVIEPDGTRVLPGQLSQGAQDQLYLALRVGIADLMAADARLPFIFDDPFVHCDQDRLVRIRETLVQLAAERQVILFSHRPDLAAWGAPVALERAD